MIKTIVQQMLLAKVNKCVGLWLLFSDVIFMCRSCDCSEWLTTSRTWRRALKLFTNRWTSLTTSGIASCQPTFIGHRQCLIGVQWSAVFVILLQQQSSFLLSTQCCCLHLHWCRTKCAVWLTQRVNCHYFRHYNVATNHSQSLETWRCVLSLSSVSHSSLYDRNLRLKIAVWWQM